MTTLVFYDNRCIQNMAMTVNTDGSRITQAQINDTLPIAQLDGISVVNSKTTSKNIDINGTLRTESTNYNLQSLITEFDSIFADDSRSTYLRFIHEYTQLASTTSTSNWSIVGDGNNLTLNTNKFQTGNSSIGFDLDTSITTSTTTSLTHTNPNPVNLSSVANTGNFEFTLYIPDYTSIDYIVLRVGNDGSNYYENTSVSAVGELTKNGFNHYSVDWSTMTETGTVTDSAIDYIQAIIHLNDNSVVTGCFIDSVMWVNESRVKNWEVHRQGEISKSGLNYQINNLSWSASFLNPTGFAESTHYTILFQEPSITDTTTLKTVNLEGSYQPLLRHEISIVTSTGVDSLTINNQTTSKSTSFNLSNVSQDDTIILGDTTFENKQNNNPIPFTGLLTDYRLGNNKINLVVNTSNAQSVEHDVYNRNIVKSSNTVFLAQSFVSPIDGDITRAVALLGWPSTNDKTSNAYIASDNAGQPGTDLGFLPLQASVNEGTNGTLEYSYADVSIPVNLGDTYWLVITLFLTFRPSGLIWGVDDASGFGGGNLLKSADGSTWSVLLNDADANFRIDFEPNPSFKIAWTSRYKKLYSA